MQEQAPRLSKEEANEISKYFKIASKISRCTWCYFRLYGAVLILDDTIIATGKNEADRDTHCISCDAGNCFYMKETSSITEEEFARSTLYVVGFEEDTGEQGMRRYAEICYPPDYIWDYVREHNISKVYSYDRRGTYLIYENGHRLKIS